MALSILRLRRALSLSSTLIRPLNSTSLSPPSLMASASINIQNPSLNLIQQINHFPSQSRSFRSSCISFFSMRPRQQYNDNEKIGPDDILFEGCDYNHWLITMDFPKNPRPTPEEMVETYVQTAAKVFGSEDEAKKRIYACSTTTYDGFQVVATEQMSEKFEGLPGVVFILPDSYIDPTNKEYGGDKYEYGKITPRPPPVQYRRTGGGGRYNDGNRGFDTRSSGYQQINSNLPPRTDQRKEPMPMNSNSNYTNYNGQGNYAQRDFQPGPRNHSPPPQTGNYGRGAAATNLGQGAAGGDFRQGAAAGNLGQGAASGNFRQGAPGGNFGQGAADGNFGRGAANDNFEQGAASDNFGRGAASHNFGQGASGGNFRQGSSNGNFGQVTSDNFGQGVASGNFGQRTGGGDGFGQGGSGGFGQENVGSYNQGQARPHGPISGSQGDFGHGENQGFSNRIR